MRFWDASAIVPMLVDESRGSWALTELEADAEVIVWWATEVECVSAIARQRRDGVLDDRQVLAAIERLASLVASWTEMEPTARVRATATRLCRTHPLRAANALQLAAAIVAADGEPRFLPILTLDDRLARAAEREGFPVIEPA